MGNDYIPKVAKIERIVKETPDIKTFFLKRSFDFLPGQFLEVSCFGEGEAPISISSGPDEEFLKLTFKRIGCVTTGLFNLKKSDSLGMRGPFGNGFVFNQEEKRNLIFIAGGIGLAPLRSLLKSILSKKKDCYRNIYLLYGSRSPKDLLYQRELLTWRQSISVLLTVDKPDDKWKGRVGVVVELLNEIQIRFSHAKAFICGPEIMMRFTTAKLIKLGMHPSDIILSLERYMKCGVGKCGHCYIADKFVCRDGPVFTYAQLNNLKPMEIL